MIVTRTLTNEPLTEEEKERIHREIEEAKKLPIVYDEDSPELTPEMEEAFKKAVIERNRKRAKQQA